MPWRLVLQLVCFVVGTVIARGWWMTTHPDAARGALISGKDAPVVDGPRLAERDIARAPPFVGDFGFDVDGYSKQRPDRVKLLNLLRLGRFDALDTFLSYYEDEFARDYRKEYWPTAALAAFDVPDPALDELLDRWIEARPNSFAAYAARGEHRSALGWHYRGHEYAAETSGRQFLSFDEFMEAARRDFVRARELRPRSVALLERLLIIANAYVPYEQRKRPPLEVMEEILRDALAICPLCFSVRASYLHALRPRWHGSYPQMDAFVASTKPLWRDNARLRLLSGLADADYCDMAWKRKELTEARIACDKALAPGEWTWTLHQAAKFAAGQRDTKKAMQLAERTLAIDPQDCDGLAIHADMLFKSGRYEEAARDMVTLRQREPNNPDVAKQVQWLVDKLRYDGDQARKRDKPEDAARMFALALELAPDDRDAKMRLGRASGAQDLSADSIATQLRAAPDDFELRRRIDYGLATHGRFAEVVTMWDAFIDTHPTDPRAFWERGGAKWHLQQRPAAIADAQHACDLGMKKACEEVQKMKAAAGH